MKNIIKIILVLCVAGAAVYAVDTFKEDIRKSSYIYKNIKK